VTVRFEPRGEFTEVIVTHEQIAGDAVRRGHELGWEGCLEGLARHMGPASAAAGPS
jgi:Activator of Hsp90 ATPase homolog 1-like protein